jgi:hypothetical protein
VNAIAGGDEHVTEFREVPFVLTTSAPMKLLR